MSALLAVLLEAALKGAAICAIVALAMPLLRGRSAAVRHAAWSLVVGAHLLLAVLAPVTPSWGPRLVERPAWVANAFFTQPAGTDARTAGSGKVTLTTGARNDSALIDAPTATAGDAQGEATAWSTSAWDDPRRLFRLIAALWLVGAGLIVLHLAVGTVGVWRLAARGRRVLDAGWLALAQELAVQVRITRPLTLLRGQELAMPVTWGVVYPVVLLPEEADRWDDEQRRYVLVHEMAHIRRFDALTDLMGQVTLALFWFDPFIWLAVSRMRVEREHACDDYVLRAGTTPSRYANDLLMMVRSIGRTDRRATAPAFAALAMARRSEFEGRMVAILEDDTPRDPLSRRGVAGGAVAAAVLVLALAGFSPLAARDPGVPTTGASVDPTRASAGDDTGRVVTSDVRRPPSSATRGTSASMQPPRGTTGVEPGQGISLDSAISAMRPDGAKTAILSQYATSGDDVLLAAALRAVPSLLDDGQKSIVLANAASRALHGDARLREGFFAAVETMSSDRDRATVLVHAAAHGRSSPLVTARVLHSAARMRVPGAAAMVLMTVAQRHLVTTDSLRALYVRVTNGLESDADRQSAMIALLQAPRTPSRTPSPRSVDP